MEEKNEVIEIMKTMESELMEAVDNAAKFAEGNKSAGTRLRANMQNVKSMAQNVRVEVQSQKNAVA